MSLSDIYIVKFNKFNNPIFRNGSNLPAEPLAGTSIAPNYVTGGSLLVLLDAVPHETPFSVEHVSGKRCSKTDQSIVF